MTRMALCSFTASVLVPWMCVPSPHRTSVDGREITPAPLVFSVQSALLSTVSMLVASCNLYRSTRSSRVIARQRIHALSWEMVDWVLYQCATTASMTTFLTFWCVLPSFCFGLKEGDSLIARQARATLDRHSASPSPRRARARCDRAFRINLRRLLPHDAAVST
ncbi:hypothetical protein PINS_up009617 [Pythium insidiosum]|nr:hypothetical protein PINS_up009617 [Pythium insidiosum]